MQLSKFFLCLFLLSCSLASHAQYRQHRDYVGGSFIRGDLNVSDEGSGLDENFDLNVLSLQLGVEMAKWFHLEGRVGFGINDKSLGSLEFSIQRLIGIHGVVSYPNNSPLRPYALAGITYGEVDISLPGFGSFDESETDSSFGAGIDLSVSDGVDVFLEYMQYIDKGRVDFSGISLGLKFDF